MERITPNEIHGIVVNAEPHGAGKTYACHDYLRAHGEMVCAILRQAKEDAEFREKATEAMVRAYLIICDTYPAFDYTSPSVKDAAVEQLNFAKELMFSAVGRDRFLAESRKYDNNTMKKTRRV